MKSQNISTPLVVHTIYQPLSVAIALTPSMDVKQWYYVAYDTYKEDWSKTPMFIVPTVKVTDPENPGVVIQPQYDVTWYERVNGIDTRVTDIAGKHYSIRPDDKALIVADNIPLGTSSIMLVAKIRWTDSRTLTTYDVEKSIDLAMITATDPIFHLSVLTAPTITYNPFRDSSTIKSLEAQVTYTNNIASNITYKWYAMNDDGTLRNINTEPCPYYVSGQGTNVLRIDMQYITKLTVVCRIAKADGTELPPQETRTLIWDFTGIETTIYSRAGNAIHPTSMSEMTFEPIINYKGATITDNSWKQKMLLLWKMKKTNENDYHNLITNPSVTVRSSDLESQQGVNTIINADQLFLEANQLLVDDEGKYIVDGNDKYVLGQKY